MGTVNSSQNGNPASNDGHETSNLVLTEKLSSFYRAFCWCAGSNLEILQKFPTEYNKHFGTGTAVVMTGIFAFISSSYALSTIFKGGLSWVPVLLFGIAWGAFIFFLDRYLVSSLKKSRSIQTQLFIASPRILLAILIGLTIARPLELKIFEDEITEFLQDKRQGKIENIDNKYKNKIEYEKKQIKEKLMTLSKAPVLIDDFERKEDLEQLISNGNNEVKEALDQVECECHGACGTKKKGRGPACEKLEEEYDRKNNDYVINRTRWIKEINDINNRINTWKDKNRQKILDGQKEGDIKIKNLEKECEKEKIEKNENFATSLLAQHESLSRLTRERSGVWIMVLVVTILFVFIEIAPILVKLMAEAGPYDQAIEDIEYEYSSESKQRRYLIREELKLNKGLISRMAVEQRNAMKRAIDEWRDKQTEMDENEDTESEKK